MKILIADTTKAFTESLERELCSRYEVYCCDNGKTALGLILKHRPDLVILDMHLAEFDGFSILTALKYSQTKPLVLATVRYLTDYIVEELRRFSVQYVLQKPVTICAAMTQVNMLLNQCENTQVADRYRSIDYLLHILSFRRSRSGYDCVREALYQACYNGMTMMTKEIYPQVAKICGGTASRVEKAIRDAITDAWSRRDDSVWSLFFTMNRKGQISCPNNSEFVRSFARCCKNEINVKIG